MNTERAQLLLKKIGSMGIHGQRNNSTGYIELDNDSMAVLDRFIRDNPQVFRITEVDKDWMIVEPAWKPPMNLEPYLQQVEQAKAKLIGALKANATGGA